MNELERHLDLPFDWPEGGMVILFAGNVGRFQGLDVLMQAMAGLSNRPDISLVIMGDGSEKNKLEKMGPGAQIFGGAQFCVPEVIEENQS